MQLHVGIVGAGPTCLYLLNELTSRRVTLRISIFESGPALGHGFPYSPRYHSPALLSNIASDGSLP